MSSPKWNMISKTGSGTCVKPVRQFDQSHWTPYTLLLIPTRGDVQRIMAKIFDKVVAILAPYLGKVTARASVKMYLKDLELTADQMDKVGLSKLAQKLKPGLKVFVGSERAIELTDEIRKLGAALES